MTGPLDTERVNRIAAAATPGTTVTSEDAQWLVRELRERDGALALALKGEGRVYGLLEAAALIEAARNKDVTVRFLVGKRQQAMRAVNAQLLTSVAAIIRRYAADAEAGKLPVTRPSAMAPTAAERDGG